MRLTPDQHRIIRLTVREQTGPDARAILFGSRIDDTARGGDIDLLIDIPTPVERPAWLAATLAAKLHRALGGRKVDVLLQAPNLAVQPIHRVAKETGVAL